ncbi:TPA: P-loop ATPase [Pseudomonas aeruginosa]|nr:P-loop ATPase [Pseudomonas aeruginosa]
MKKIEKIKPWEKDKMGRSGIAKFLTHYLDDNVNIKVLNINSPWGGGKTFFLTNWREEQSAKRACVYFNAWESDFTGDPFVSLVSAIREQLADVIGPLKKADDMIKDFTRKASKTLIAATPALAKGVVKKFTGVDVGLIAEAVDNEAWADAAEKAVEKLIENNKETANIVKDFKVVLEELVKLASHTIAAGGKVKPVYFFIDELDRCRPTFAIELLERVKHLFDVTGCKFIIATDTAQLTHSIRAVYGEGFSSDKYLKRFFDIELTLDNSDIDAWVKANVNPEEAGLVGLNNTLNPDGRRFFHDKKPVSPDVDTVIAGKHDLNGIQASFAAVAKTFKSKLREMEKINLQIGAIRANVMSANFHYFWAAYLTFLKDEAPELFESVIRGDYEVGLKNIISRYPAKKLYFVFSNVSIHEIFVLYIRLFRGGPHLANNYLRSASGNEHEYIQQINIAFSNEASFKSLCRYPALVELAHSLD